MVLSSWSCELIPKARNDTKRRKALPGHYLAQLFVLCGALLAGIWAPGRAMAGAQPPPPHARACPSLSSHAAMVDLRPSRSAPGCPGGATPRRNRGALLVGALKTSRQHGRVPPVGRGRRPRRRERLERRGDRQAAGAWYRDQASQGVCVSQRSYHVLTICRMPRRSRRSRRCPTFEALATLSHPSISA